jgi:phage shock protein E
MLSILKNIFGSQPKVDYKELLKKGAQLIDVRTREEYGSGHLRGAVNIPLQQLPNNLAKIRKDKPVITYCASGMRSSTARNVLRQKGFQEVYNGGGINSLQNKIR